MKQYILKNNCIVLDENNNKKYSFFKDEEDMPREKLIKKGPEALTSKELLAAVLGTGTKKEDVWSMSARILKEYGEKSISNQKNAQSLQKELDIPEKKACQIIACFELGRRFFQKTGSKQAVIRTARQVYNHLEDMHNLPKEQLRGLYLNSRYRLVHDEVISVGTLTANIVHPREVFRPALDYCAVAVIIAHNHPSGLAKPTAEDIEMTEQLVRAGKILGIDLLDHIVIAGKKFSSVPAHYTQEGNFYDGEKSLLFPNSALPQYKKSYELKNTK